mgnify:CR=1 FL=1
MKENPEKIPKFIWVFATHMAFSYHGHGRGRLLVTLGGRGRPLGTLPGQAFRYTPGRVFFR